jgi:folate-binding protein YgfZ
MTHSSPLAATEVALDDFAALSLDGADAIAFAQAQCAGDLAQLAVGHWQWSCWLNPQGRVIVLLLVLRTAEQRLLLLAPGRRADELAQRLRRFVFRAKLRIETPELAIAGVFGVPSSEAPRAAGALGGAADVLHLRVGGCHGRQIRIGGDPAAVDPMLRERWRMADVLDGIPWILDAGIERWIPQALALDRLQAFSVRKGCYPGQEIVARTHFLGRNKRALWLARFSAADARPGIGMRLLASAAVPTADAAATAPPEAAAEVVSDAIFAGQGHLLVVARGLCPRQLHSAEGGTAVELEHALGTATNTE